MTSRNWEATKCGFLFFFICKEITSPPFIFPVKIKSWPRLVLFPEGIPAAGYELTRSAVFSQHQQHSLSGDFSNRGESHTSKGLRQELCFARGHGEQQFVVIPAMQRELQGIAAVLESEIRGLHLRDLCPFQSCTDRASGAQPRQIARKSIGEVYHCGRQALFG